MTSPDLGSIILSFLSLQVVANLLPSWFQATQKTTSGWQVISVMTSPVSRFQMQSKLSWLALNKMFAAVGCHLMMPTRRWWWERVTSGVVRSWARPLSGISQIMTLMSSELEAIMLSSKGFHAKSKTSPWWPATRGLLSSTRPVYITINNKQNSINSDFYTQKIIISPSMEMCLNSTR